LAEIPPLGFVEQVVDVASEGASADGLAQCLAERLPVSALASRF